MSPTNILKQDQVLSSNGNSTLISSCKRFRLVMQEDGNLVIYAGHSNQPSQAIWSSETFNKSVGPFDCIMQCDGNLVVYDKHRQPLWATGTHNTGVKGDFYAQLKNGQLIIKDKVGQIFKN